MFESLRRKLFDPAAARREEDERRAGRALAGEAQESPGEEVARVTIDGTLDLHTFRPAEVRELVPEYLSACQQRGLREVRIVHGKGTGTLRNLVHALLQRDLRVDSFRTAGEDAGGWGATLVRLKGL